MSDGTSADAQGATYDNPEPKGLKTNAIGLVTSTAVGLASTAPAYSMAATLGFVVVIVGVQTPLLVLLAFVPMFFSSWANKEMNTADPDCGSSFTWAARALGPRTGWFAGGWGQVAADLLVMASYAQIAGQYVFFLFGANGIGSDATSGWVLLVGIGWIVLLTYLCYRGVQVAARIQVALIILETVMLAILAVVAFWKVGHGTAPIGHLDPSWSWFNPFKISSFNTFMEGMLLMVFIYWGWDTTVSLNEETSIPRRTRHGGGAVDHHPARHLPVGDHLGAVLRRHRYPRHRTRQPGPPERRALGPRECHLRDLRASGQFLSRMLILMVLTSTAATAQTTILPNARTTLSMAFHKALPEAFGRVHPKYRSPTVSTVVFSVASVIFYLSVNWASGGNVISDSVTSSTFFIALYLGITGFACAWHYRRHLTRNAKSMMNLGIMPFLSGVMLFGFLGWNVYLALEPDYSYTTWSMPFFPHWDIGGVLLIGIITAVAGLVFMLAMRVVSPSVLPRARP